MKFCQEDLVAEFDGGRGRTALKLTDYVGTETLEAIQTHLAAVTGANVVICDAAGDRITRPEATSSLCRLLSCSRTGHSDCLRGIVAASEAASPPNAIVETPCHAGLTQLAVPIVVDSHRVGLIVVGDRPTSPIDEAAVRRLAEEHQVSEDELHRAVAELPVWTDEQRGAVRGLLELIAETLSRLCHQEYELQTRVEGLGAVFDVAGMVAEVRDLQAILDTIVRLVAEVMKVRACSIRLLDPTTGELTIRAVHNLSEAYLKKGPVLVRENPIDAAAISGETVYVADVPEDPRTRYPEQARSEGIVSCLIVGMAYRGRALGVIRVYTDRPHRFTAFEAMTLRAIAAQAAVAIANSRLMAEAAEAEQYFRQLKYAGEVQRRMIPGEPPPHPHIEFGCVYSPSLDVGGDFYDFVQLPEGHLGIAVCDVVGHGVAASLLMSSVRGALRAYSHSIYDIDEVIGHVNRALCRDTLVSEFATLFYGVFSADGRRLTYCNAGHMPPMLLRDGQIHYLDVCGPAIGLMPKGRFAKSILHLKSNDRLLFFTDGATEALDFNDEAYGRARLARALIGFADLPTRVLPRQIQWDVKRFMGLSGQTDDITLVAAMIK
jgi:sigma-B regulation protein RsbU (phosphoserine phosphatase)